MESYTFNIVDYKSYTSHLTPLEDICCRRIIDWLYLNEKPLPLNITNVCKEINMPNSELAVKLILDEFFIKTENGYFSKVVNKALETQRKTKQTKGSRLKQDWVAPDEYLEFCNQVRPDLNADIIADTFKDYWISVTGAKGTKLDWFATWRNWVRGQKVQPSLPSKFKNKSTVISDEHFEDWLGGGNDRLR